MLRNLITTLLALSTAPLMAAPLTADTSYGSSGRASVYYDLGGGKAESMLDMDLGPGGASYAAGSVEIASGRSSAALVKRTSGGLADTAFAAGTYSNSWLRFDSINATGSAQFNAVAFDATGSGRVIAAGYRDNSIGQRCAFAVMVLDNNVVRGALDGSFGSSGTLTSCATSGYQPTWFSDAKVLADGKILLLLSSTNASGERNGTLIRLRANGLADMSFNATPGVGGVASQIAINPRPGKTDDAQRIAVTNAGYLVGGSSQYNGNDWDGFVQRITTSGVLDASFGSSGTRIEALDDAGTAYDDRLADLVADSSDRPVLLINSNTDRMRVIRLTAGGARDASYNGTGLVEPWFSDLFGSSAEQETFAGAALAADRSARVWVVGSIVSRSLATLAVTDSVLGVLRLDASGANVTFNNGSQRFTYGQQEFGATAAHVINDRVLVGTRLRTSSLATDFDFGYLKVRAP